MNLSQLIQVQYHNTIIMASTCDICCEAFNRSTRESIECMYGECDFKACKACMRQYLLGNNGEPHCMSCKQIWSNNFMVMKLNRNFVDKTYSEHYTEILTEREISRLPETMEAAEAVKRRDQELENYLKDERRINSITSIDDVPEDFRNDNREQNDDDAIVLLYQNEQRQEISDLRRRSRINVRNASNGTQTKVVEKRKFIMPCPGEDCRGFLSSQYKCQLCSIHVCSKCFEIIGTDKSSEHKCNEDNVKTAEMIKKDTKPCPACGTRISKISGCDQMWCVECHQAFSWKTGSIVTGMIHNPHFYEHKRNMNNGMIPRAPGDIVCGGLCGFVDLSHIVNKMNQCPLNEGDKIRYAIKHKYERIEYIPATVVGFTSRDEEVIIKYDKVRDYDKACAFCGSTCNWNSESNRTLGRFNGVETVKRRCVTFPKSDEINHLHRMISHITHVSLENARRAGADEPYEEGKRTLRVQYILSKISKKELGTQTYKIERKRKKNIELLHIYELLNVVGVEMFTNMLQSANTGVAFYDEVVGHMTEFRTLCKYCNDRLCEISVSYDTSVIQIRDNWNFVSQKASLREARKANKQIK